MKKFLLGTTALIGAGMIAGGALAADSQMAGSSPTVSLGGFADFEAGWAGQKSAYETGVFSRAMKFRDYNQVHVNVNGQTDNGIGYGAVLQLEANVTPDDTNYSTGNADKAYIFIESRLGRLEFGSNTDAARTLKVDAATFARASGGIDGDWYHWVNITGVAGTSMFIVRPDLPTAEQLGTTAPNSNKITYYSPRISGFQGGISFTPDQGDIGTATGWTGDMNGNYQNVVNGGLNYTAQIDKVSVAAAATGEWARNELSAVTDELSAYNFGANAGFAGFTVGGSFGEWNHSLQANSGAGNDSYYWDIGGAYETGPYALSVTFMDSRFASNKFTNVSVGTDYKLAPGLTPFVEASFFELKEHDAAGTSKNNGSVVLAGTQLNF